MEAKVPAVYAALQAVKAELQKTGIAKLREVKDGVKFKFRGIDDVLDTFAKPMDDAKLMAIPSYSDLTEVVRATKDGKANYNVRVQCAIEFVSLIDGSSKIAGPFYGEASDTQDKASAKAQSIALRIGYLTTFTVPLGAAFDPEADPEQQDKADTKTEEKQAAPKSTKDAAPAAEGQVADPVKVAQKRILYAAMKPKGLTAEDLAAKFGELDSSNFNKAVKWAKESKAVASA